MTPAVLRLHHSPDPGNGKSVRSKDCLNEEPLTAWQRLRRPPRRTAAEAATLWGGAFLWTRKAGWRPNFVLVDGRQVDYAWIDDTEDELRLSELATRARTRS